MSESKARGLWQQLRERNVIRVAVVYVLVGWIAILAGEAALESLGVPLWVHTVLIVLILLGFPIVLRLAWVYEFTPHGIRKDSADHIEAVTEVGAYHEGTPSIAVLPFRDLSLKANQAYFCEGLAEEIINALRQMARLRVASRAASFQFGSNPADIDEVGRKLKVQTVLEGEVRKSGDDLWIMARLVEVPGGSQRWSCQYDCQLQGIFTVQEEIAVSIAGSLGIPLQHKRRVSQQQVDSRAYDFLLRGLSYFARHTIQDNVYARQMLKQAIEIEPEFGRAWAGMAFTHGFEYMYFNASNVNLSEAKRTSKRALELAPELASSHVSAGIACCMSHDYKASEAEFEKAIRLDPMDYEAWYFFGRAKVHEGDLERALKLFKRAALVRPEDYQSVLLQAQLFTSLDQRDQAMEVTREGIERARAALDLNPDDNRALNMGAFALLRLGQVDAAKKWMSASMKNAPMDSIIQYNGACFFSLAGDVEHALDCLENCLIKVGNISREWLEHDSDMDNIRGDPRYATIIASFPD